MSRVLAREMEYSTSPAGVITRVTDRVAERLPGGNGQGSPDK
jgi:hypothetical protein